MSQDLPKPGGRNVTPEARRVFNEMLDQREQEGIRKYGTTLQTDNGRDAIQDAAEEMIDGWQYLQQARMERDDLLAANIILSAMLMRIAQADLDTEEGRAEVREFSHWTKPSYDQLIDQMAALAHDQWSGWMEWMFKNWSLTHDSGERFQDRWLRQMGTVYADLSEREKESDRVEARKLFALLAGLNQGAAIERARRSVGD